MNVMSREEEEEEREEEREERGEEGREEKREERERRRRGRGNGAVEILRKIWSSLCAIAEGEREEGGRGDGERGERRVVSLSLPLCILTANTCIICHTKREREKVCVCVNA